MRRGNKPEIIFTEDGKAVLGVNLSSDFCAEHEWGIKDIKREFGIPEDIGIYGMERRKITICPKSVQWVEFDRTEDSSATKKQKFHYEGFVFHQYYYGDYSPSKGAAENSELRIYRPWKRIIGDAPTPTLAAAWSGGDFGVVSCDEGEQALLRIIFSNFETKNIVIMFSGKNTPFENPGLVLGIADRIPKTFVDLWYEADKEHHELRKEVEASGIEDLLKKANKRYYALSPRRDKDGIKFWLNPQEQKENNYGWFTLDDLKLWAVDEGPIPVKDGKAVLKH